MSNDQYPDGLNEEQYITTTTHGHIMTLAGAGAGKTRVLTIRLRNILEFMNNEQSVLCLTFSKKASTEMKDRLYKLQDKDFLNQMFKNQQLQMGTFHAFGAKYLRSIARRDGSIEGRDPRFTIADSSVQKKIIKGLMDQGFTSLNGSHLFTTKEGKPDPSSFLDGYLRKKDKSHRDIEGVTDAECVLIKGYEYTMRMNNAVDFSDLINMSVRHMEMNAQDRIPYNHVIIDEFQDTSATQYQLMLFLSESATVFCVGDVDQSIYEWRSALPTNVTRFIKQFNASLCLLESNYRSTPAIVYGANALIEYNKNRPEKTMRPIADTGNHIIYSEPADYHEESKMIAKYASKISNQEGCCAILYRRNVQSRLIEQELTAIGAPYTIIKDVGFMNRKEISTAMNLLKYLRNPSELQSFNMSIEHFVRGVSAKTSTLICEQLRNKESFIQGDGMPAQMSLCGYTFEAIPITIQGVKLTKPAQLALGKFLKSTNGLSRISNGDQSMPDIVKALSSDLFYEKLVKFAGDKEKQITSRKQNIDALFNMMLRHSNLGNFLDAIALDISNEDDVGAKIQLMTIHASKGLEFDHVIIAGHTESNVTSMIETDAEYEEARRLMYVAVTRAKKQLIISSPKGIKCSKVNPKTKDVTFYIKPEAPCHFASEIPPEYMPSRPSNESLYHILSRCSGTLKHYNPHDDLKMNA